MPDPPDRAEARVPAPRVALVRLRSLGDVVLASAAVEALAGAAELAFVTRLPFAPLFEGDPRLARLVVVDPDDPMEAGRALEAFDPEWVVDLQGTLRSRQLVRHTTARVVRVKKASIRRRLAVVGVRTGSRRRVYERYLDAVEETGLGRGDVVPRLVVAPRAAERAEAAIPRAGGLDVGLVPGAAWANKRWPLDRWTALARALLLEDPATHVHVVVSEREEALAGAVLEGAGAGARERMHRLEVPLGDLPAHLRRLDLLVTGDSGPMHVAEAVGTPVVALFGPTVPAFGFAPFRSDSRIVERRLMCRPCHVHGGDRCPLGHHRCMRDISVTDIIAEVREVLERELTTADAPPIGSEGG